MTRSRARRTTRLAPSWPLLLGALIAGSVASCDNPACVFGGTGCQVTPGGGANQVSATFPETGEWTVPVRPTIEHVFPSGFANPESPVVIVFSESISPSTIDGAFAVQNSAGVGGGTVLASSLVGDGRVLVLIVPPLIGGQEYQVTFTEDGSIRDLSGSLVNKPADGVVGTFSVDDSPAPDPKLLMTWPLSGSSGASPITEVVTVFDRNLNQNSVNSVSWQLKVDGVAPAFNPAPEVLFISAGGGGEVPETRVWTWKSIDTTTGERVELGTDVNVTIELSQSTNPALRISTPDDERMLPTIRDFQTLPFSLPMSLMIESEPADAIGIENLSPTGSRPLMMSVDFPTDALPGDVLEIFMVGSNPPDPNTPDAPDLISRVREIPLTAGPGPHLLEQADFALLSSTSPLAAIFDDDDISFAFALSRGTLRTPLRVLDVDSDEEGVQDAFIDLNGPDFLNLIGQEEKEFVLLSDLRELSVSGLATDEARSVEVIAHLLSGDVDNRVAGEVPPVPSVATNGNFIAAPVDIGQLDFNETNVMVDVIVYDRALNPSPVATLDFTQRGSSGVGLPISSGNDIDVTVFDSLTLEPIENALVYRHESVGGVLTPTVTGVAMTNSSGYTPVSPAPGGDTLITVEAAGYDLFTFQGVPTTRLDVPLMSETISIGLAGQTVSTPGSALTSPFLHAFMADSRVLMPGDTFRESTDSSFNPLLNATITDFSQVAVDLGEVGLLTFLATKDPADLLNPDGFFAGTFLQAFALEYPRVPLGAAPAIDVAGMMVSQLLSDAGVAPEDTPIGTAAQVFVKPPNYALDFPNPDGDPQVSVEAFTYGIHGMMTIGLGLAYFNGGADNWDIRSAYSARARAGGELATKLAIEDERFLRVEVVDTSGNRTGVRQPLSSATGTLTPAGVPLLTAPATNSGGPAFDLMYENVITGALDDQGLYRVILVDSLGRRWHLWTPDTPDGSGAIVAHVPPIGLQGGVALEDGIITAVVSAWAWPGFDPGAFLFSDLDRSSQQFTTASPKVFSQP